MVLPTTSYFVFGPASVTLEQAVQVAGTRWQVEQTFELAKGEVRLDEYLDARRG